MKRLIVTADDFGAAVAVNEAVERAHRDGILNTASLMIGAPAADDAVARARRLPGLRVGLHVVVVCGRPVLPPDRIPGLVDGDGALPDRLTRAGLRYFFLPAVRRQLEAEIRAQFARFRDSGLTLDHVNAHNHMHLHPTVLRLIIAVGREFGLRAMRVPYEPFGPSWRAARSGFWRRLANDALLRPMLGHVRRRLRRAGIAANDRAFGLNDTGDMNRERVLGLLANLPEGVSEIYFHPATGPWPGMEAASRRYRVAEELTALTDPGVAGALTRHGIKRTTFGALSAARA